MVVMRRRVNCWHTGLLLPPCNYAIDQKFGHIHVVHASRTTVCQDINPCDLFFASLPLKGRGEFS